MNNLDYDVTSKLLQVQSVSCLEDFLCKYDITKASLLSINLVLTKFFKVEKPTSNKDNLVDIIREYIELYKYKELRFQEELQYTEKRFDMIYKISKPYIMELGDKDKLYINKLYRKSEMKALEATPNDIMKAILTRNGHCIGGRENSRGKKLYIVISPNKDYLESLRQSDTIYWISKDNRKEVEIV